MKKQAMMHLDGCYPSSGPGYPYNHLSESPEDPEVRLLYLDHLTSTEDEIRCALKVAKLRAMPKYQALSYTWGDPHPCRAITVDMHEVPVRENLFEFLKCFRNHKMSREPIWIDQICINQSDDLERSYQVRQMRHVYELAENVLIWLGNSSLCPTSALHYIQRAASEQNRAKGVDYQLENALDSLLGSAYFRRLWIVQEIAMARQITVWASDFELHWDDIVRATKQMYRCRPGKSTYLKLLQLNGVRSQGKRAISWLIHSFGQHNCTDPRDRLYGLCGIADAAAEAVPEVDYRKSVLEVFVDFDVQYTASPAEHQAMNRLRFLVDLGQSMGVGSEVVKELTLKDADISAQCGHYDRALQAACFQGHLDLVKLLLGKGANINRQGGKYGTALQAACSENHVEVAKLLIENGAELNKQNEGDKSEFSTACVRGYVEIVRLLLEKSTDVDAQNALQAACSKNHVEIVKMLFDKGAVFNTQSEMHTKMFWNACHEDRVEVLKLLLENGANIDELGKDGTALQVACSKDYIKMMKLLVERGADVDAQGSPFGTALQTACSRGNEEMVNILLMRHVNIHAQCGYYGNALQAACFQGNVDLIKLLLEKGADINAQGGHFGNALQAACLKDTVDLVKLLLENGADVDAQGGHFGNALQAACFKGNVDLIKLLLERGVDVNARGGYFGNALQAACFKGDLGIVNLLLDNGANIHAQGGPHGSAVQATMQYHHQRLWELLVARGANRFRYASPLPS